MCMLLVVVVAGSERPGLSNRLYAAAEIPMYEKKLPKMRHILHILCIFEKQRFENKKREYNNSFLFLRKLVSRRKSRPWVCGGENNLSVLIDDQKCDIYYTSFVF